MKIKTKLKKEKRGKKKRKRKRNSLPKSLYVMSYITCISQSTTILLHMLQVNEGMRIVKI